MALSWDQGACNTPESMILKAGEGGTGGGTLSDGSNQGRTVVPPERGTGVCLGCQGVRGEKGTRLLNSRAHVLREG